MSTDKFSDPKIYRDESTSNVWSEYTDLAEEYNPVNLGQGFPDFLPPKFVQDCLKEVAGISDFSVHQYCAAIGHPMLRNKISQLYTPFLKKTLDPTREIIVTGGAYKALHNSIFGHVDEGDEVILIEPFFDCYVPMVRIAGGIAKFVTLKPEHNSEKSSSDWVLKKDELSRAFNNKTKAIIINSPHNPTGKVFSREELQVIAELCIKWNVLCISDEVYEWLTYGNAEHVRIATLEGMWERTITISSSGKAFGVTGWKIGWAYGPDNLLQNLRVADETSVCSPMQVAVALVIDKILPDLNTENCFFKQQAIKYEKKMRRLLNLLNEAGMKAVKPEGGFFILADWTTMAKKTDIASEAGDYNDTKFTKWLIRHKGILGIPTNSFYCKEHKSFAENYVRFCFIKAEEKFDKAASLLSK